MRCGTYSYLNGGTFRVMRMELAAFTLATRDTEAAEAAATALLLSVARNSDGGDGGHEDDDSNGGSGGSGDGDGGVGGVASGGMAVAPDALAAKRCWKAMSASGAGQLLEDEDIEAAPPPPQRRLFRRLGISDGGPLMAGSLEARAIAATATAAMMDAAGGSAATPSAAPTPNLLLLLLKKAATVVAPPGVTTDLLKLPMLAPGISISGATSALRGDAARMSYLPPTSKVVIITSCNKKDMAVLEPAFGHAVGQEGSNERSLVNLYKIAYVAAAGALVL